MMRTSANRGRSRTARRKRTILLRTAVLALLAWAAIARSPRSEASPEAHDDPPAASASAAPAESASPPPAAPLPSASPTSSAPPSAAHDAPSVVVVLVTPKPEPPPAPPRESRHKTLPDFPPRGTHAFVTVAPLGACTRIDDNVGKSGFCGELLGGTDTTFAHRWHFDWEAGFGTMDAAMVGFRDLGFSQRSGGPYFVARALLGFDLSSLFIARFGVQTRIGDSFGNLDPGVQGVLDLGTRWLTHFEVGIRTFVGVDGVVTSGGVDDSWYSASPAYGTSLFARYVCP